MRSAAGLIFNDPPRKTRADYRDWRSEKLLRQISIEENGMETADTDEEWFDHIFALQELRAVLQERLEWARAH